MRGNRIGQGLEVSSASGTHVRALEDEALIRLVGAGDARALEQIFDRHSSAAFSLALRICRSQARAEDVVQEAFLALWRFAPSYQPARGSVRAWLLRIVHNRAIDIIRRNSERDRRDIYDAEIAERFAASERTETQVLRADEECWIRAALAELPAPQRQVIDLAFFDGLTHAQIAQLLELPAGTVKGRMRLGLAKLRLLLADAREGVEPGEPLAA